MVARKVLLCVFVLLVASRESSGQIPEDFYSMYNLHIVIQPTRPSVGLQIFDWTIAGAETWDLYVDVKVRLLSDVLNVKSAPYSTNEPNFVSSLVELRFGLNFISTDSYNAALGVNPLNAWSIAGRSGTKGMSFVTSGVFAKVDVRLSSNLMMRYLLSPDFVNLRSSGSDKEKVFVAVNALEVIHRSGLYVGIEYIYARMGPFQYLNGGYDTAGRLELKTGIKLL